MKSPAESLSYRQSLLEFLEAGPAREDALLEEFGRQRGPDDPLYSSLLYLLTHLDFTERQAARHWKRLVAHCEEMSRSMGRDPGPRVAFLDYFVNVSRELRNPKVIDISMFERTERSAVPTALPGSTTTPLKISTSCRLPITTVFRSVFIWLRSRYCLCSFHGGAITRIVRFVLLLWTTKTSGRKSRTDH